MYNKGVIQWHKHLASVVTKLVWNQTNIIILIKWH